VPARVLCTLDEYLNKQQNRNDNTYLIGPCGIQAIFTEEMALHEAARALIKSRREGMKEHAQK
jgi:hypothetical protein